ncbi:MAG: 16S rRNA (guanine(966)-N(2))-methyltransferase RsmD [Myxococcota bacterium]
MGLRITGGRLSGRKLRTPRAGARPTADRVRESLFARLGDLEGADVLDCYAGSGALGIEALSRGARSLVCIERARGTAAILAKNLELLGLDSSSRVIRDEVTAALPRLGRARERFDLVLMDPPYASKEAPEALAALVRAGVLAVGATVVLERGRSHPVPDVEGLSPLDERRYGDTVISRFTASALEAATASDEDGGPLE